jgi:hypothetical protein
LQDDDDDEDDNDDDNDKDVPLQIIGRVDYRTIIISRTCNDIFFGNDA